MSLFSEYVATLRIVLTRLDECRSAAVSASSLITEGGTTIAAIADTTSQADMGQAAAYLDHVIDELARVAHLLDMAIQNLVTYLAHIGTTASTEPSPPASAPIQSTPPAPPTQPVPPPPEAKIEALRAQLPPPLAGPGTGRKTHGRWFVGDGSAAAAISGYDAAAKLARAYLGEIGERESAAASSHVEVKIAALVRYQAQQTGQGFHVTVVLNNEVCEGPLSCWTLLPRLLPFGCSLTVHTPKANHTFKGGTTS